MTMVFREKVVLKFAEMSDRKDIIDLLKENGAKE